MTTSYTPDAAAIAGSQLTASSTPARARPDGASAPTRRSTLRRRGVSDVLAAVRDLVPAGAGRRGRAGLPGAVLRGRALLPVRPPQLCRHAAAREPDRPAITACHGDGRTERLTRGELREKVGRLAGALQRLGVRRGDRVVAIARNNAEVAIAALAAAAIGAPFSSCGIEMGGFAIRARFARLGPVVLLGTLRSEPWEHGAPVADRVAEVAAGLPSLTAIVALDDGAMASEPAVAVHRLADLIAGEPAAESRGSAGRSTIRCSFCFRRARRASEMHHARGRWHHAGARQGAPPALRPGPGDKLFYQTSPGWMMWNWQLSALASGVELVLYDGPLRGPETLWTDRRRPGRDRVRHQRPLSPVLRSQRHPPGRTFDLTALRGVLSTGSILYRGSMTGWARR